MKAARFALSLALISLPALAFAQVDAQKSFETLKSLEGTWEGHVSTVPPTPEADGKDVTVVLRVTSRGNALLHEMFVSGRPDDPITMIYLDSDRLTMTHYCDAGNRPHMIGKKSADGKFEFDTVDVAGSLQYGHMHQSAFTIVDATHHTEDWTFMAGDNMVRAHMVLQKKQASVEKRQD